MLLLLQTSVRKGRCGCSRDWALLQREVRLKPMDSQIWRYLLLVLYRDRLRRNALCCSLLCLERLAVADCRKNRMVGHLVLLARLD